MPTVKVYHHGVSGGMPGMNKKPPKRGDVGGWSVQSARRNSRFLQSIWVPGLTGHGYAFTLTVKDCPPTSDHWKACRTAYLKRLERAGAIRIHWLTEWQRRGVPHLHGIVYFPESSSARVQIDRHKLLRDGWLAIAQPYGAKRQAQHVALVDNALGWAEYLGKHGARGIAHYQRSPESVPPGWTRTGRMWGAWGDWPITDPEEMDMTNDQFWRFRRLLRSWECAKLRAEGKWNALSRTRRTLKNPKHNESARAGIGLWIPGEISARLADLVIQDQTE